MENSCIQYSKETLLTQKGHIVNFISADGILTSAINRGLRDAGLMSIEAIKSAEHEMGQVVVLFKNNRYVFNLVVRNAFDERPYLSNIESAVQALKQAMDYLEVPNASVMKNGNNLDQLSWLSIEKTFRQIFKGSERTIKVCSGEIKTPREKEREAVVREYHESAVGGHKGVSKTYWRIRADYYWEGMRNNVQKFIRECKTCQEYKLVRSKTYGSQQHSDGDDLIQYDEYVDVETGVFHKIPIYDDTVVPSRKKVTGRKRKNSEETKHSTKKIKGKFLF